MAVRGGYRSVDKRDIARSYQSVPQRQDEAFPRSHFCCWCSRGSSAGFKYSRPNGPMAVTWVTYSPDFAQWKWDETPRRAPETWGTFGGTAVSAAVRAVDQPPCTARCAPSGAAH